MWSVPLGVPSRPPAAFLPPLSVDCRRAPHFLPRHVRRVCTSISVEESCWSDACARPLLHWGSGGGGGSPPVLEIECIPKLVIIGSDCIPGFRSVCPMCIPTFSSFIVLRAQFPSPSFPCGSSPDTMKQLSLKPHLTAPSAKADDSSSSSGSPAPFFMVCMYHMCIPGF